MELQGEIKNKKKDLWMEGDLKNRLEFPQHKVFSFKVH